MPRKNIREVAGKPLLAWTIEQALASKLVDRYVVSTDDEEIAEVANKYRAEVIMRPSHLATDSASTLDGLLHALDVAEQVRWAEYGIVADIRATNPLKTSEDINACVNKLRQTGADVVVGVSRVIETHPSRLKQILPDDRLVDVWPELSGNRQDLSPPVYVRNGSIYACRVTALREGIHFSGGDIRGYEMPAERSVNVDGELDLLICEALLTSRN